MLLFPFSSFLWGKEREACIFTLLLTSVEFTHCLVILFLLRYISLSQSLVPWCIFPNKWLCERANSESHRWTGCTLGTWDRKINLFICWVTGESWSGGLWGKHTLLGIWGAEGSSDAFGWMEGWPQVPESLLGDRELCGWHRAGWPTRVTALQEQAMESESTREQSGA